MVPPPVASPPKNFTPGAILRWRRVEGLVLAETTYEAGERIHRHAHDHARFVMILAGSMSEVRGDLTTTYGPSTLLFRRAGEPHSYVAGERGARCLVVDMSDAWLGRVRGQAKVLVESRAFRRGLLLHLAHRLYGEFRQRDEVSRLAIESLTLGLVAEASRRVEQIDAQAVPLWLQLAITLIEQRFQEPLSLTAVAKQVGVHPVHLARTFRRVRQTTVQSYVRQLRLEFARAQLVGPAALSEIAIAAGFCDQSHFTRCFKRHTGVTPARYRARLR